MTQTEDFHYAAAPVDVGSRDLPGLKAQFIVRRVEDESIVVDVGCGGGKMLRTIGNHHRGVTLRGCDIVERTDIGGDFEFSVIDPDTQRLPYEDDSTDVALLVDVLDHTDRPQDLLNEIVRILRPSGKLVAFIGIEGEPRGWYRLFRRFLGEDLYTRTKDHAVAFTHADVRTMLNDANLVAREQRYAYHLLGGLMDAALFAAVSNDSVQRAFWAHSPYHGEDGKTPSRSLLGRIVGALFKLGNAAAWAESRALRNVRATASGVLVVATPKP